MSPPGELPARLLWRGAELLAELDHPGVVMGLGV